MITKEQAKKIGELCIEVKPEIEDAFIFLNSIENDRTLEDVLEMTDEESKAYFDYKRVAHRAGDRMLQLEVPKRKEAIHKAYQMIDNMKKYGVACVAWMPD